MDDICFAAAGGGLNCWDALFGLLGQFDIASDFWYWSTIKDNHKIDVHARNAVLVFAIIGALLEVISWCQYAGVDGTGFNVIFRDSDHLCYLYVRKKFSLF